VEAKQRRLDALQRIRGMEVRVVTNPVRPTLPPKWTPERQAETEAAIKEREERAATDAAIRAWDASTVPARYAQTPEADKSPNGAWSEKLEKFSAMLGNGCMLSFIGNRGSGKTHLAAELIRRTCANGRSARYIRAMTFFIEVKDTYGNDSTFGEKDIIERYMRPHLLVIDELQERGATEWEDRLLVHLMDLRYGAKLDTILISNLTRKQLETSLGPSVVDRMRETGGITELNWSSLR